MNGQSMEQSIILASQSPRRAALLRDAGIPFEIVHPRFDEPSAEHAASCPAELAESLSYYKAASVADEFPDSLILGADTVVAVEGRIFGKPRDADDARRILGALMGTTQEVITGISLFQPASSRRLISHDVTRVTMRRMSADEMDEYIAGGEWEGKAGAYGIQDNADRFITRVEGSFSNVVGLPMELLEKMLSSFAVPAVRV